MITFQDYLTQVTASNRTADGDVQYTALNVQIPAQLMIEIDVLCARHRLLKREFVAAALATCLQELGYTYQEGF